MNTRSGDGAFSAAGPIRCLNIPLLEKTFTISIRLSDFGSVSIPLHLSLPVPLPISTSTLSRLALFVSPALCLLSSLLVVSFTLCITPSFGHCQIVIICPFNSSTTLLPHLSILLLFSCHGRAFLGFINSSFLVKHFRPFQSIILFSSVPLFSSILF